MTTHELAAKLLTMKDEEIYISVYTGGDDELLEVKGVVECSDEYAGKLLVLVPYKAD
jgi:hypothetical protein